MAQQLFSVLSSSSFSENQCVLRATTVVLLRACIRCQLSTADQTMCHTDASYLITGGLGGLGLRFGAMVGGFGRVAIDFIVAACAQ
jgi:hypothetical protein